MSTLAEIAEVLDRVDDLLCSEENFCQGQFAQDEDGNSVNVELFPEDAVRYCLRGAVWANTRGNAHLRQDVNNVLMKQAYRLFGTYSLFNVNDDHDEYQSYRMVRRIIDEARKEV